MSVAYSTMPLALRGARSRSVITALRGSLGSISPNARPTSFSYGPTSPNDTPPNVGDSTRVIWIRVMLARASIATPNKSAKPTRAAARRVIKAPLPLFYVLYDTPNFFSAASGQPFHSSRNTLPLYWRSATPILVDQNPLAVRSRKLLKKAMAWVSPRSGFDTYAI